MNENQRMKNAAGLTEAKERDQYEGEYNGPDFDMAWGTMKKGRLYLAVSVPYEGHTFYEVPNGTKMKDFKKGGKYREWVVRNDLDDYDKIDFIFKCLDQ